ncbi:MAG: Hsp20/alpha crystallin family protein [Bdellovibrionota bacterium]
MSNPLQRWLDQKDGNPFRDLSKLESSFDRFFHEMMKTKKTLGQHDFSFSPSCEITDDGPNYVLKFDMPGVKKENIKVEVNNGMLTVSAERKEEKKQESAKKFLSEVFYGTYSRSFSSPVPVDEKNIDAKFENGVLTVKLPKPAGEKAKEIAIQ